MKNIKPFTYCCRKHCRRLGMQIIFSLSEPQTLWLMQSFSCHIIFPKTPTYSLPHNRDRPGQLWRYASISEASCTTRSPLLFSATVEDQFLLVLLTSANVTNFVPRHVSHTELTERTRRVSLRSYLFKLSEAVHLYRWTFLCFLTRIICTNRKRRVQRIRSNTQDRLSQQFPASVLKHGNIV